MTSLTLVMEDELYRVAVKGDRVKYGEPYYKDRTTPRKNNIIHIAVQHSQIEFMKRALARFPLLGHMKSDNGDTPLHVAARKGNDEIVRLLVSFEGSDAIAMQNLQGDTPLHLALSNNKLRVARSLLQVGFPVVLSLINNSQETPLHNFLKYCIEQLEVKKEAGGDFNLGLDFLWSKVKVLAASLYFILCISTALVKLVGWTRTHATTDALLEEGVLNLQGVYKSKCQMNTHGSLSSSMIIENVLTKLLRYKTATYLPDAKGLTPLLMAAQRGNFLALKHILKCCPQSAEICDPKGKTVLHHLKSRIIIPLKRKLYARDHDHDCAHDQLHGEPKTAQEFRSICYWELKELFQIPEIDAIKDAKDLDGNTPVHAALENEDFVLVKVLFECFADFTIKNMDGDSALDLIKSIPDFATKMEEVIVTEKVLSQPMDEKLFKAAKEGDLTILRDIETDIESGKVPCSDGDHDYFSRRTSQGLTILHIAIKHGHQSFVEEAIKHFPTLVLTADSSGENSLHVAARLNKDHCQVAATLLQLTKDCVNKFKEEIDALVKLLMQQNEHVVYKRDSHGLTPLLRAAYCGRIRVAYWIIHNCPASVQFRDPKGRNFLYLLRLEPTVELDAMTVEDMLYVYTNILALTSEAEVDSCQGPILMPLGTSEVMQEMNITNNKGQSVSNLLELLGDDTSNVKELKDLASLVHKKIKQEAFGKKIMDAKAYENVWEKACRSYHDSPSEEGLLIIPPWRVKNCRGNTPLHEAANSPNIQALGVGPGLGVGLGYYLLRFDFEATTYVNAAGDTPLHIDVQEMALPDDVKGNMRSATYVKDKEGLTPLLRAAKVGNYLNARSILRDFPELIQLRDDRGRSFLHLFRVIESEHAQKIAKRLYNDIPTVDALRKTVDFDGNTPLHSAIEDGNSMGAKLIAERYSETDDLQAAIQQLIPRNNQGKSIADLLASHNNAPTEVMQLLIDKSAREGMYMAGGWVRSGYGVCKSQIKDMANTLSVVAGLLVTITFAAAFQVPGGFNGESGSPVLLQRAAFKAFMIFNSFAMCGSMTVLFFLLWVMLAGSVTTSFLLLDMSITILQLSFGATFLSFTTGVYVATSHKALGLAILVCGLCSTLVVLLRKNFILPNVKFVKLALRRFGLFKI
ncbi:hypothetical protein Cgig2_015870 [Carnegiea gigantea]|uniref:PGG domain-containing protein n=1 Tax=Carnegiea gigantea TaxID=171969 RepID=A0A9Q1GQH4_9CARY|nr:hypothetical protein Cgig2_015870 [Carnegiea gigantea]